MGTRMSGPAGTATATAERPQSARSHPRGAARSRAPHIDVPAAAPAPAPSPRALIHPPLRRGPPVWLRTWTFRVWLVGATVALCATLLWLQSLLGAVPLHPTPWQAAVQWAELIWLCPVPSAAAIWLGWVLFAAAARPDPAPIAAPQLRRTRSAAPLHMRLVLRIPTRGENASVLRDAVAAAHEAFAAYPEATGPYRIEIVSERPLDLGNVAGRTRVYVVPPAYATPVGTRFKARALAYLQAQVRLEARDWCVYLDEESLIDTAFLAGIYRFIQRARPGGTRREQHRPCPIGQGAILYQGGDWLFRGADTLRTADDLGRFRLQYALGAPIFGIHGSYVVVRGLDDAALSFDVGERNSLTEDAAWSLRAWARGRRFAWVEGYLYEQPPQSVPDFVRQRARWLAGIRRVLCDRTVPLRYRLGLGIFTTLWQLSFLPFLVAIAAVIAHVAPFAWMRLPADFAWASYVLAYFIGADRAAARRRRTASATPLDPPAYVPRWLHPLWRPLLYVSGWVLALAYLWYALLEAAGVVWSLTVGREFFVIRKPSLTHSDEPSAGETQRQPTDVPALEPVGVAHP